MTNEAKQTEKQTDGIWPIKGVRVDGDKVIITVRGGNDAARWLCGELLAPKLEVKPLTSEQAEKAIPDVWMLQFLTDVVTSAGLLRYGKQSKALAERISSDAMRMRQSLFASGSEVPPIETSDDLMEALKFLLAEQCKGKGYWAPGAEMARLAIAKANGADTNG